MIGTLVSLAPASRVVYGRPPAGISARFRFVATRATRPLQEITGERDDPKALSRGDRTAAHAASRHPSRIRAAAAQIPPARTGPCPHPNHPTSATYRSTAPPWARSPGRDYQGTHPRRPRYELVTAMGGSASAGEGLSLAETPRRGGGAGLRVDETIAEGPAELIQTTADCHRPRCVGRSVPERADILGQAAACRMPA